MCGIFYHKMISPVPCETRVAQLRLLRNPGAVGLVQGVVRGPTVAQTPGIALMKTDVTFRQPWMADRETHAPLPHVHGADLLIALFIRIMQKPVLAVEIFVVRHGRHSGPPDPEYVLLKEAIVPSRHPPVIVQRTARTFAHVHDALGHLRAWEKFVYQKCPAKCH